MSIQYAHISTRNQQTNSIQAKFLLSAHANFFKLIFLKNAWVKLNFWLQNRNQRKILRPMICRKIWFVNDLISFQFISIFTPTQFSFHIIRRGIRNPGINQVIYHHAVWSMLKLKSNFLGKACTWIPRWLRLRRMTGLWP